MRPRFSLRLLFIAVIFTAITCYSCLVRPVAIAHTFAEAVETRDYDTALALYGDSLGEFFTEAMNSDKANDIEVELYSRKWRDFWRMRQRVSLRVIPGKPRPGTTNRIGTHVEFSVIPTGICPDKPYYVSYSG